MRSSLGSPDSASGTASRRFRLVQPFLHSSRQTVPILQNGHPSLSLKNCLHMRVLNSHVIHDTLGPSKLIIGMVSGSILPFLHSSLQSVPIVYNGLPLTPQNCPFYGGAVPPFNTWFTGPTYVFNPNGVSIGWAVFAGLTILWLTDRQTTTLTRSVILGRIYIGPYAMRPKIAILKNWVKQAAMQRLKHCKFLVQ